MAWREESGWNLVIQGGGDGAWILTGDTIEGRTVLFLVQTLNSAVSVRILISFFLWKGLQFSRWHSFLFC